MARRAGSASGNASPDAATNAMPITTAATCATSRTVTSGRMRDWSPPRKSARPQQSDEENARTTASTARQPSNGSLTGRGGSVALAAAVEQLHGAPQQTRGPGLVGEHVEVALGREAGDQQRLLARVLADPPGPVARAHPRRFPPAHRQLEREVFELRVVDADGARLDPARERLAARGVLRPHGRGEPVGGV